MLPDDGGDGPLPPGGANGPGQGGRGAEAREPLRLSIGERSLQVAER